MKKILFSLSLIGASTLSVASNSNLDDLDGFPKDPASSYSFGTYYKKETIESYVRKSKTAYRKVKKENGTLTEKLSTEEERTLQLTTTLSEKEELLKTNGEKGDIEDILLAATHAVDNPLLALSKQTEELSIKFSKKGSDLFNGIQSLKQEIEEKSKSVLKLSTSLGEQEEKLKELVLVGEKTTQETEKLKKEIGDLQSAIKKEKGISEGLDDQLREKKLEIQEIQKNTKS